MKHARKTRGVRSTLAVPLVAAAALAGCDAVENAVIIRGVIAAEAAMGGNCTFMAGGTSYKLDLTMDVSQTLSLVLPLDVENNLFKRELDIGNMVEMQAVDVSNDIYPLRYEVRWECDSNGFTSDLGPLVVPAFDPERPFCLDRRADTNEEFVGFDFVSVDGQGIEADDAGVVMADLVPFQLGQAFSETLTIARLADQCCSSMGSACDGQTNPASQCDELASAFELFDPEGRQLQVASDRPGSASEDLVRFSKFAVYDGSYYNSVNSAAQASQFGAKYPLRARGVLEMQTSDGFSMTTNELLTTVFLCRNCGTKLTTGGTRRNTANESACYFR